LAVVGEGRPGWRRGLEGDAATRYGSWAREEDKEGLTMDELAEMHGGPDAVDVAIHSGH
jgi:hypothetical protein